MAKSEKTAEKAENEGLAQRLVELRGLVEEHRVANARAIGEIKQEVARMNARVDQVGTKVDNAMSEWETRSRSLGTALQESGEQVRAAGAIARDVKDRIKVLDELREQAEDPRELLKPIRIQIAHLTSDFEAFKRHTNDKVAEVRTTLERLSPSQPYETRGDALATMGEKIKRLESKVAALLEDT